jgi:hypothetical protein
LGLDVLGLDLLKILGAGVSEETLAWTYGRYLGRDLLRIHEAGRIKDKWGRTYCWYLGQDLLKIPGAVLIDNT